MSVNLLLSPNEKQLYMSKLSTDSLIYDAGASFKIESGSFTDNTIIFNADTPIINTVYTVQEINWCTYNLTVFFNIGLEFSDKGIKDGAGDENLYIDLPVAMPNSKSDYIVIATARRSYTSTDKSNGYAQFDIGTKRLRLYNDLNTPVEFDELPTEGFIYITGSYVAQV